MIWRVYDMTETYNDISNSATYSWTAEHMHIHLRTYINAITIK